MSKLNNGYYSAIYLLRTSKILKAEKFNTITEVQFFQRNNNVVLCGITHVLKILKNESYEYNTLKISSLKDGDIINANEPVLKIVGNLWKFIHLEGIIDGILARESTIATKSKAIIDIIGNNKLIYMNDRSDYFFTQEWDGYAAYIGGVRKFVTEAQVNLIKNDKKVFVIGTIPHALIQTYQGNIIKSLEAYSKHISKFNLVALVDYNNDVINDSLKVANKFKENLFAVRVDTSLSLIDKTLAKKYLHDSKYKKDELYGVNHLLAKELREALDNINCKHVKIIFSSGLNYEKILKFVSNKSPIDFFGVGANFSIDRLNFVCDAVKVNGILEAKYGRKNINNNRLKVIK